MLFPLSPYDQPNNGLKRICDIQKADNGWLVTTYKDTEPSVDEVKNQLQGFGDLMRYFQSSQTPEESWKQPEYDVSDAALTAQNLLRPKKKPIETHLFLDKEELLSFLASIL